MGHARLASTGHQFRLGELIEKWTDGSAGPRFGLTHEMPGRSQRSSYTPPRLRPSTSVMDPRRDTTMASGTPKVIQLSASKRGDEDESWPSTETKGTKPHRAENRPFFFLSGSFRQKRIPTE